MNNEYLLKGQIEALEERKSSQIAHLRGIVEGLNVFRWVTLALYLAFTLSLYIGDIMHLRTIFDSFGSSLVGFILYLAIAVGLAYSLASFKHRFYLYRGEHGGAFAMVIIVIVMGLMAEVFQSGGQQDVKARAGASQSADYQTLLKSSPTEALNQGYIDPYDEKIITLQGQLGNARELERTCKKTCSAQHRKVESLEAQIAGATVLQQQSASRRSTDIGNAQVQHVDLMNQVEEKHYNPTIKSVKELTGVGIGTAVTLIMGLISIVFEICHSYFSRMYSQTLAMIESLNAALLEKNAAFANLTGREYKRGMAVTARRVDQQQRTEPDRTAPYSPDLTAPMAALVPSNPVEAIKDAGVKTAEAIAIELARAQTARDNTNRKFSDALQQLGNGIDEAISSTPNRPAPQTDLTGQDGIKEQSRNLPDPPEAEKLAKAQQRIAELQAEKVRLQQQRTEADLRAKSDLAAREAAAELGNLTADQISVAARAIRYAIEEGRVTTLGFSSLAPVIKDAGLPKASDSIRALIKHGCRQLSQEWGGVQPNPNRANGRPEFVIVGGAS